MDQPQIDREDQDGSVQCLCFQHTDARQRDVDHICQTGENTQLLPTEKHPGKRVSNVMSCIEPTFQASSPCSDSAGCVGWVMATAWKMAASQKTLYMENWHQGRRTKGRPQLRYKDVCKRDMKALDMNSKSWEDLAADCMRWRSTLNQHLCSVSLLALFFAVAARF